MSHISSTINLGSHDGQTSPAISGVRSLLGAMLRILPADAPQKIYSTVLSPRPIRSSVNALLKAILPKSVQLDGKKLFLNPDDVVVSGALALGIYENHPRQIFRRAIKPGATAVDIGANVGVYTLTAHAAGAKVIAYEPDTRNREFLSRSIAENEMHDVIVRAEALGETTGTATLYLHPDNKGKHSLLDTGEHKNIVNVPIARLDDSLRELGVSRVDVVKIDVEGYEAQVIDGALETLRRDRPVLFFEYAPVRIRLAGKDPGALLNTLRSLGYVISTIDERAHTEKPLREIEEFVRGFSRKDEYVNLIARSTSLR